MNTEQHLNRATVNMQAAALYAHLSDEEAMRQAHEDYNCVGLCKHCEAENVKTWSSQGVTWRLPVTVKGFIFPVFQEWTSSFAPTFVHASQVGAWVTKAPFMVCVEKVVWNSGGSTFTECFYSRETGRVTHIGDAHTPLLTFKKV